MLHIDPRESAAAVFATVCTAIVVVCVFLVSLVVVLGAK
jgi:hypothetical protein